MNKFKLKIEYLIIVAVIILQVFSFKSIASSAKLKESAINLQEVKTETTKKKSHGVKVQNAEWHDELYDKNSVIAAEGDGGNGEGGASGGKNGNSNNNSTGNDDAKGNGNGNSGSGSSNQNTGGPGGGIYWQGNQKSNAAEKELREKMESVRQESIKKELETAIDKEKILQSIVIDESIYESLRRESIQESIKKRIRGDSETTKRAFNERPIIAPEEMTKKETIKKETKERETNKIEKETEEIFPTAPEASERVAINISSNKDEIIEEAAPISREDIIRNMSEIGNDIENVEEVINSETVASELNEETTQTTKESEIEAEETKENEETSEENNDEKMVESLEDSDTPSDSGDKAGNEDNNNDRDELLKGNEKEPDGILETQDGGTVHIKIFEIDTNGGIGIKNELGNKNLLSLFMNGSSIALLALGFLVYVLSINKVKEFKGYF